MAISGSNEPLPQAVVTGASAGIGRAIAAHLLATGWQVAGLDRNPATLDHPTYHHHLIDLGDQAAIERLARQVPAQALVHAAGFMHAAGLEALDLDAGQAMWQLHVQAATALAQAWLAHLQEAGRTGAQTGAGGRVVFIGSRISQGFPGRGQYAAVKAALVAMARSWAAEWASQGITFNVVSPAATATAMMDAASRASSPPKLPPMGRLIQPEEVAALVAYLLSPAAAAMTGQELTLCGGASLAQ